MAKYGVTSSFQNFIFDYCFSFGCVELFAFGFIELPCDAHAKRAAGTEEV